MAEASRVSRPMGDEDPFPLHVVSQGTQERLCTAQDIRYRAFRRPYPFQLAGQDTYVLTIVASCRYKILPWKHRFNRLSNFEYQLMEAPPYAFRSGTVFYAPVFCSGGGIPNMKDTIKVTDSYGEHLVKVEDL